MTLHKWRTTTVLKRHTVSSCPAGFMLTDFQGSRSSRLGVVTDALQFTPASQLPHDEFQAAPQKRAVKIQAQLDQHSVKNKRQHRSVSALEEPGRPAPAREDARAESRRQILGLRADAMSPTPGYAI